MACLDSETIRSALVNKMGCKEEPDKDHIWFTLYDGETVLARTKISHGPRHDIGDDLILLMKRQMRLGTSKNFVGMVSCSISKDDCLEIIRSSSGPYR
jgi:hypothetical protein